MHISFTSYIFTLLAFAAYYRQISQDARLLEMKTRIFRHSYSTDCVKAVCCKFRRLKLGKYLEYLRKLSPICEIIYCTVSMIYIKSLYIKSYSCFFTFRVASDFVKTLESGQHGVNVCANVQTACPRVSLHQIVSRLR